MRSNDENQRDKYVKITEYGLEGDLFIPKNAKAMIIFAHGSGSSRFSSRNLYLAQILNSAGFGTLLVDLLTLQEKRDDNQARHVRFDIALLSSRMESVTKSLLERFGTQDMTFGYFGSSTGSAAALIASTKFYDRVKAVVSRGGRPDLAEGELHKVFAPTLLIVGEMDEAVIGINRRTLNKLKSAEAKHLIIIPAAGHLFEEPGKMEQVAANTVNWFRRYLLQDGRHEFHPQVGGNSVVNFLSSLKNRANIQLQFNDRVAAGEMLATKLHSFEGS